MFLSNVQLKIPKITLAAKLFYSINVQGVCDCKGYFMDVKCMWPVSVHDAKVFGIPQSIKMRNNTVPIVYQSVQGCKIPCYLIGNPAYPLTPYCIKEYATCSSNIEVVFNSILRSASNHVECAFGRLKARWGILTRKMDLKLEIIPVVDNSSSCICMLCFAQFS